MSYRMRGRYFGSDDTGSIGVKMDVDVTPNMVKWRLAPIKGRGSDVVTSKSREVRHHIGEVCSAIRRANHRNRVIQPIPKPGEGARCQRSEAVLCPTCKGVQSYDCDRCEGAGVVPG